VNTNPMKYIGVTIHPYSYQMGQMFVDPQIHSLSCLHSFFNTLAHCVSLHNKDVVARRRAVGMILDALRASPPGAYKTNRHNACRRYFGVTDSYSLIIGKLVPHRWSKIPLPSGKKRRERAEWGRWPFLHGIWCLSPSIKPAKLLGTAGAFLGTR
jgi:hypothetical protein